MNLKWGQYDLCENSDLYNFLNSPETPLSMTRALLISFGITATANSPIIASGVPHQLLPGKPVSFQSTGTLPAPLVAGSTYYVVAVPTLSTFTISTVLGGAAFNLTTTGTGQHSAQDESINAIVTTKRGLAKDIIRQQILINLKHRIPEIIDNCLSYKRLLFHKFVRGVEYDVNQVIESAPLNAVGVMTSEGVILNVLVFLNSYPMIQPRVFMSFGVPDITFEAGVALTGDLAIDTSLWNQIYINKGTDINFPNWVPEYTAKDAINNLLNAGVGRIDDFEIANGGTGNAVNDVLTATGGNNNATFQVTSVNGSGAATGLKKLSTGSGYSTGTVTTTSTGASTNTTITIDTLLYNELLYAAVYQTILQMMDDGEFRNRASYADPGYVSWYEKQQTRLKEKFQTAMRRALPILEVDIDGDGIIHDAERRLMDTSMAVIG